MGSSDSALIFIELALVWLIFGIILSAVFARWLGFFLTCHGVIAGLYHQQNLDLPVFLSWSSCHGPCLSIVFDGFL